MSFNAPLYVITGSLTNEDVHQVSLQQTLEAFYWYLHTAPQQPCIAEDNAAADG
jgi:hypothetical protein